MFRILELVSEQSTGGVVDKVVVCQDSVAQLIEELHPATYHSITKVGVYLDVNRYAFKSDAT